MANKAVAQRIWMILSFPKRVLVELKSQYKKPKKIRRRQHNNLKINWKSCPDCINFINRRNEKRSVQILKKRFNRYNGRCRRKCVRWNMNFILWSKRFCMLIVININIVSREHCFQNLKEVQHRVDTCQSIFDGRREETFFNLSTNAPSSIPPKHQMATRYTNNFSTKGSFTTHPCKTSSQRNSSQIVSMIIFVNSMPTPK